jgi:hypothetical protein
MTVEVLSMLSSPSLPASLCLGKKEKKGNQY